MYMLVYTHTGVQQSVYQHKHGRRSGEGKGEGGWMWGVYSKDELCTCTHLFTLVFKD